ncbi:MAG: ActS/PrrB/RegB family redox-sensitive histidine kinase [Alphaproteobacteria bacterium]
MNQAEEIENLTPDAATVSPSGSLFVIDGRVQLRTLTRIRWIAVIGQLMALFWVQFGLNWSLPINSALLVVGISVLLNLVMTFRHPEQGLLKEWEAAAYLAFDTLQLAFLLYLTGGLTNPFALLFLGPVTVSATVLTRRATAILCGLVIVCATALVFRHLPLPWTDIGLELPSLYVWGLWTAVVIGTLFLAVYAGSLAAESRRMSNALSVTQLSLAREQQLSAVGGLAAAAAHELGSPLSTILVTATELNREMQPNSEFNDDIKILCAEAVRCKEILAELLVQPSTEDSGAPFARIHLSDLVRSAADRYPKQGVSLDVDVSTEDNSKEPIVFSSPEFNHGLGNIVQNALQFANEKVSIQISWSINSIFVIIRDDGPGFSPALLDRVGEPYISTREDDHLGLGLFIAQSLLQRTGGRLTVSNIRGEGGYVEGSEVLIKWLRSSLDITAMKR